MVILDRVFCDICECHIGQLFNGAAVGPGMLELMTVAPHFACCPDCLDRSNVVSFLSPEVVESGDVFRLSR